MLSFKTGLFCSQAISFPPTQTYGLFVFFTEFWLAVPVGHHKPCLQHHKNFEVPNLNKRTFIIKLLCSHIPSSKLETIYLNVPNYVLKLAELGDNE